MWSCLSLVLNGGSRQLNACEVRLIVAFLFSLLPLFDKCIVTLRYLTALLVLQAWRHNILAPLSGFYVSYAGRNAVILNLLFISVFCVCDGLVNSDTPRF